jgi:ABC-2 type transport system permease protein
MVTNMSKKTSNKTKSNKANDLINLLIWIVLIGLFSYIGSYFFYRFDLTSEKRYSISEPSKQLAKELEDVIYFKVYLEGDFPAGFKRLRDETKEMLDEFRAYSDGKLEYEFINPSENPDEKERDKIYKLLYEVGLRPTDLEIKEESGISNKLIWPGALVSYRGKETPLQLLKSSTGAAPEVMLNQSIEALEYEIAASIKKIISIEKPNIAFIEGHGELDKFHTADITATLEDYYDVSRVDLKGNVKALSDRYGQDTNNIFMMNTYELLIIAKPDSSFSEKDKYLIDQHIMHGGKVLWIIDQVKAEMDSLSSRNNHVFMALGNDLNLDDQLFKYGVRINKDLIQDIQSAPIPVVTGMVGNQTKTDLFPWNFFPMFLQQNKHPITKGLDAIRGQFVSSIDLVGNPEIKKTVLLETSPYTKVVKAPTRVSLDMVKFEPQKAQYNQRNVPAALLLEGEFESVFKNRLTARMANNELMKFKEKSEPNKMIVISDGDMIENYVKESTKEYYALGYDRFTKKLFANKDFILNCVNYLVDDSGLMLTNSKTLSIRLLDKEKIKGDRVLWQVVNIAGPIFIILLMGGIIFLIRKRKYTNY